MTKRSYSDTNDTNKYFSYEIQDILKDYHLSNSVSLEEYSNLLTKYKLLRLSHIFLPLNITEGCITPKNVDRLLTIFNNNNKDLRSLNLSNCIISEETIKKLLQFPNLKSINLTNSFNMMFHGYIDARNQLKNAMILLSNFSLIYLDISDNSSTYSDLYLMCVPNSNLSKSLQYLNISSTGRINIIRFDYSIFTQLNILNVSNNLFTVAQLNQIATLKLKELHAVFINIPIDDNDFFDKKELLKLLINNVIIKMKTLETLDISNYWENAGTKEVIMKYLIPNLPNIKVIKMVDLEWDADQISEKITYKNRHINIFYSSKKDY